MNLSTKSNQNQWSPLGSIIFTKYDNYDNIPLKDNTISVEMLSSSHHLGQKLYFI